LPVYRSVYILTDMERATAKLFRNGGSQAVRLPRACRFPQGQKEVLVSRRGRAVVLEPADEWSDEFLACLGAWPGTIERPRQAPLEALGARLR
jgi:antitoxin VapB